MTSFANKLKAMTDEQLEQTLDDLCDKQGRLGDAEHIHEGALELVEIRINQALTEQRSRRITHD